MPIPSRIRVMISSRNLDQFPLDEVTSNLTTIRQRLTEELESEKLFDQQLFDVWINEDAPALDALGDSWAKCMEEVRKADIVLVLYNGNSGWAKAGGDIGICHAEFLTALTSAPAKIRLIELDPLATIRTGNEGQRDQRFRDYVTLQNRFRAKASSGEQIINQCKKALRDAVTDMVQLGVREARKGKFYLGEALDWSRFDYPRRRAAMERTLRGTLVARDQADPRAEGVFVPLSGRMLLMVCHAIPDAITVPAARELVGQPFLHDYRYAELLDDEHVGPVHIIACHRGVTEAQARRQLGFPDAVIVSPPFGVYVADNIQKIQLILIANCRDDTTLRHGVQRTLDWLDESGESALLAARAAARGRIVRAIARELASEERGGDA